MTPRRAALAVAAAWVLPLQAAEWSLDSSLNARLRVDDDRPAVAGAADRRTRELRLGGAVTAARSLETQATRLDLQLDLPAWSPDAPRNLQGRGALSQSWQGETDTLQGSAELNADDTLDGQRSVTDVLAGGSRRLRQQVAGAWQHRIDERLDTRLSARRSAVRVDDTLQGGSFSESQLGGTLNWRFDERTQFALGASRSRYARDDGTSRTGSDSLSVSATWAASETDSASAGFGAWRSRRDITLRGLVCPLPESFCAGGLVARVPVEQVLSLASHGTQYSLGWQGQADERTRWTASASRDLAPGLLGVQQSDTLGATWVRQLTPELSVNLAARQSSSSPADSSGSRPRLRTLDCGLSWRLAEDLTLNAGLSASRLSDAASGLGGRSRQFSISLQYQGPRLFASR